MKESLLKFLGIWAEGAQKVIRVQPAYHAAIHPALLLLILAITIAVIVWLYRREEGEFTRTRRIIMTACRILFLVLLGIILLRPVLAVTIATSVRETMVVLVDTSSSMQIADLREQNADRQLAAIALGQTDPRTPLTQPLTSSPPSDPPPARIDLAKAALTNKSLDLLPRIGKEFLLSTFTFDRQTTELTSDHPSDSTPNPTTNPSLDQSTHQSRDPKEVTPPNPTVTPASIQWITDLQSQGDASALGDAIRNIIAAKRGQALGGIFVITDGASNTGSSLATAAQLAKEEHIPIYSYGVGITSPKDIIVSTILGPEVAFVNDELPVTVRIRSQGFQAANGSSQHALLVLKMDGTRINEKEVTFDQDGEQIIPMKFTPAKTGAFTLEASITPRPEEIVKDNNTSSPKHLRVVDGRIKVLHIEQSPRWEFKYLQAMLMRDRRVDYHSWLLEADPGVTSEFTGRGSPYLDGFPTRKEDLLRYDLVIFGDVDPRRLPPGAMDQLNSFVSNFGGGFIMIAGQRAAPQNYRRTPIEQMLPIELDLAPSVGLSRQADLPIHLELTPAGKTSPFLRLAEKDADSLKKWEQLPPIYWTARVARAKPAAEVLIVDTDPSKATRFGKMPVVALEQYGLGQVLYVGTDNTWRWRRNQGEETFNKVWSQLVERMALAHMLGLSKRTQLSMDKEKYSTGDRVTAYARLYRENDFEPITQSTLKAFYSLKSDNTAPREVLLRALPDQPGMYRAEFVAPPPGTYQFKVETDTQTSLDFLVAQSNIELAETALNEAALRELAHNTGGTFSREEDLYQLPDQMHHTAQPILSNYDIEIWSSPAYFLAILIVVSIEWFLRKRAQLK